MKRQSHAQTSGSVSPASPPSAIVVPTISGSPSLKAAAQRPRGVSTSPGRMKPASESQSLALSQASFNSESLAAISARALWRCLSASRRCEKFGYAAKTSFFSFCRRFMSFCDSLARTTPALVPPPLSAASISSKRRETRRNSSSSSCCCSGCDSDSSSSFDVWSRFSATAFSRRSSSAFRVLRSTAESWPRLTWRSTKGRSTTSWDVAGATSPVSMRFISCAGATLRRPATESVGA
mmetsp:Transcript_22167/g.68241  ORF Transcript_22167/g.68241 Transcript_22167/m.68241 type:complete len:237 (+) Transcript_22167:576-1286(+)